MMIEVAYFLFVGLMALALLCSLWRVWKGPTIADRVNAADVIALCCIGLALGHGFKRQDPLWLDFGLVAALVLFVGTTAVSQLVCSSLLSRKDHND